MVSIGALIATFAAGLLSFLSPCTVPLMPAYLACVSGVSAAELRGAEVPASFRARLVAGSVLYVLGFATVFVISGTVIGGFGGTLSPAHGGAWVIRLVEIAGGILMVVFGLAVAGVLRWQALLGERHLAIPERLRRGGVAAAFPLGVVFGLAWTPCVGGYLSAALTLAAISATAWSGGVLLFVYALGIGMPFVLVALVWASMPGLPARLTGLSRTLTRAGGVLTAMLGVLIITGAYTHLTSWLVQFSVPH